MGNFSLGEAVLGTSVDLKGMRQGMDGAQSMAQSAWQRLGGIAEQALGFFSGQVLTRAFDAVLGVAREIGDTMLNEAPQVEQLRTSFENLAASAGTSADEVLESMRRAANGMVTDASLMESYNTAMLLVGESMATKFPELLRIAQASAAATGQDVGFMLDSLVKGIGRGSPMILDNLGMTINLQEVYDSFAKTLGITTDQMSKAQQQEALLNAVVAAGGVFVERLGDNTGGTAASLAQLRTTFENLKMDVALGLLPALQALLTPLGELASKYAPQIAEFGKVAGAWLGENLPRMIDTLIALFEGDFQTAISNVGAIILTTFGPEAAQGFLSTIDKIRSAIEDVSNSVGIFSEVFGRTGDPIYAISAALVNFPDLKEKFDGIAPLLSGIITTIMVAITAIKGWFDANGTTILAGFLTAWVVLKDTVLAALAVIWPSIQSSFTSIGSIINSFGQHLAALGIGWDDVARVAGTALTVIGALLLVAVGVIAGAFSAIATLLASLAESFQIMSVKVLTVIENFKNWWAAATVFLTALFAGDWDIALAAFGNTWEAWWELVGSVLDFFLSGLESVLLAGLALVSGFVDGFVNFFGGLIGRLEAFSLRDVGIGLIEGFVGGIESAATSVSTAIGNVIQGGIDAAKGLLGIQSPSKVFEELAQLTTEGFEVGLQTPDIAGASAAMANRAIMGAQGAGGGLQMGGLSVVIEAVNIHDDRDIDDLVEQISERLGAALQSRLRLLGGIA